MTLRLTEINTKKFIGTVLECEGNGDGNNTMDENNTMARMPKHRELDLYDYIDVLTGKEQVKTNDGDIVGRHLEEVLAAKLNATLDKFEEPDLPELGVNLKSGGLNAKQNTIGSITDKRFKNMNDTARHEWLKSHTEKWHYTPRSDEIGMTGGSYNINMEEGTHGGLLLQTQFEEICNKIDNFVLSHNDKNWPRCLSDDKGMWAEYDRTSNSWKFRMSKKNRIKLELRDNMFDNMFEL